MGAAAHLAADQPGILQRLDVLGGGRQRYGEGFGKLADRSLAIGEVAQHPAAAWRRRGRERRHPAGVSVIQPCG